MENTIEVVSDWSDGLDEKVYFVEAWESESVEKNTGTLEGGEGEAETFFVCLIKPLRRFHYKIEILRKQVGSIANEAYWDCLGIRIPNEKEIDETALALFRMKTTITKT